jgi:elongation factor P
MAFTSDLKEGMYVLFNGDLYSIIEREFYKPGKGGAYNRCKLRNLRTGKVLAHTFGSNEKLEEVTVENRTVQYLYVDGDDVYFMDPESFDQFSVKLALIPGGTDYLHPDCKYIATSYEDEILGVQIPIKMGLLITETTDAVKGNTTTNAYKEAILETGAKVQVPLFISQGDRIIINTETNSYVSKEN